jgi:hypothetical protein
MSYQLQATSHRQGSLGYKRFVIHEIIGNYVDLFFILVNHFGCFLRLLSIMIKKSSTRAAVG